MFMEEKDKIQQKWASILGNLGLTGSKAEWMSQYVEIHSNQLKENTSTEDTSVYYFGPIPGVQYSANTNYGYTAKTNVFQVENTNYLIRLGSALGAPYNTPPNDAKYYIQFTSATPGLSTPIVILSGFDT